MTNAQIAEAIGVDATTIWRLGTGRIGDILYMPAARLIELAGGQIVMPDGLGVEAQPQSVQCEPNTSPPP